jgi:type IV secretory pathway TraG/TraD family ATPase VirD4
MNGRQSARPTHLAWRTAMKNYAGHRLSPWLGHLMVSRQETARPLMTAGEVMQLPPEDEIVTVAGVQPIHAKKVRYFEDAPLKQRILPVPKSSGNAIAPSSPDDRFDLPPVASFAEQEQSDREVSVAIAATLSAGTDDTESDAAGVCDANQDSNPTRILHQKKETRRQTSSISI